MTKTPSQRNGKVRFLQSLYSKGRLLQLPEKMEFSNIIQPESLPTPEVKEGGCKRPNPEEDVYDFPNEYWPPKDTDVIPQNMGANELYELCKRSRKKKKLSDLSNSAVIDFYGTTMDLEHALQRIERCPKLRLHQNLQEIRQQLSYPDNVVFEQAYKERRHRFVKILKKVFKDRKLGNSLETDCPEQLTREIGRRLRSQVRGSKIIRLIPCRIDLTVSSTSIDNSH